jgi:sortase (surface protein transpeptidase)
MGLIRVIFELFVLYLLYKLIFDFIIPVYQTTKQVKQKVGEMQNQMNEQMKQQQPGSFSTADKQDTPKPGKEDYIEFEEVK